MKKKLKISLSLLVLVFTIFTFAALYKVSNAVTAHNLYILRRGNGAGDVLIESIDGALGACGDTCSYLIEDGDSQVNFKAEARPGSIFLGWSIDEDSSNREPMFAESTLGTKVESATPKYVYAKFMLKHLPDTVISDPEDRNVPRIMFWFGKVNQHWNLDTGTWETDEDGYSGARENKLEYCQKYYPETEKVVFYKSEQTSTWKAAGNVGVYESTKNSYRCVLKGEDVLGTDASGVYEKPNSGSICYYMPDLPLCLPLSDPRSSRGVIETKIDDFVSNGVDDNSIKLGLGERVAVIKSYDLAFNRIPETEDDYQDVVKISNGNWPSKTSSEAEIKASNEFKKIYKREPSMLNQNDEAAITVMAYGLRQKAQNRNLSSEAAALKTFRSVYNRLPSSTLDWNVLQGISYSGATRELDSDGDLLSDRRELELGTDPYNKDTDGDGYFDGIEVANGYDPLRDESKQ